MKTALIALVLGLFAVSTTVHASEAAHGKKSVTVAKHEKGKKKKGEKKDEKKEEKKEEAAAPTTPEGAEGTAPTGN